MSSIIVHSEHDYRTTINIRSHTLYADEPTDAGGFDSAPMPMEIFISTLGACIAVTCRAYANRKQWPLEDVTVEVEMERIASADYPAYRGDAPFVHVFREKVHFAGDLSDGQRARLFEIAAKCPVRRVMENPIFFEEQMLEAQPENN